MPPPSLPNISVMPGSLVLLSSPIVPVSPPPVPHVKVEVSEPLDRPLSHSRHPCRVKTPYVVPSLSPSPLVVSPIIHCALTISIPPQDTPIPVLPTLRKRVYREPSPPASPLAKKWRPANTSMSSYYFFYFFIIDIFLIARNLQSLYGLCLGHLFLNLVPALFAFPTHEEMVYPFFFLYLLSFLLTSHISFLGSGWRASLSLLPC